MIRKKAEKHKVEYASEYTSTLPKDIFWIISVITMFTLLYIYVL